MTIRKFYIETYGCQMNVADSELVAGILEQLDYVEVDNPSEADLILVNSCSVRDGADARAIARLDQFKSLKYSNPNLKLGLIGCVAQRVKGRIFKTNPHIDFVIGPDSYRDLPKVLQNGTKHVAIAHLSCNETYEGLQQKFKGAVTAYIPIMRGCDKFCSFCIVPYVRGRERSRSVLNIIEDVKRVVESGFKEVYLLGQNVNSYNWNNYYFPDLLREVAEISGVERIRFTSPHPADVNVRMLEVMQSYNNICKHIHLPLQAGSDKILKAMNRNYTQKDYLNLVELIWKYLPNCAITTDIIVGFPGESDEDFKETIKVMEKVVFDAAFMFQYSPRPGTKASKLPDDVPQEVKHSRLEEVIGLQKEHTLMRNRALIGSVQTILIEGSSKKNVDEMFGRTDSNKITILKGNYSGLHVGDIVKVKIKAAEGVSLFAELL